jgi:Protein of unknown function (DUF3349)
METIDTGVAPHLRSTVEMLGRAYPEGIPERDYMCVVAILGEFMSERSLAEVVSRCSAHDRFEVGNDWASLSRQRPIEVELNRVRDLLLRAGLEAWIDEERLDGSS